MALKVLQAGIMSVTVKHVLRKPDGSLYYKRRVPTDLHPVLGSEPIVRSLKTRDLKGAAEAAHKLNSDFEALWASLRSAAPGLTFQQTRDAARARLDLLGLKPGGAGANPEGWWTILEAYGKEHGPEFQEAHHLEGEDSHIMFLTPVNRETERLFKEGEVRELLLSGARDFYLSAAKPKQRNSPRFVRDVDRVCGLLKDVAGDLPLKGYTRDHARRFRDKLIEGGAKTATVRRRVNAIAAIINTAKREHSLDFTNPFEKLSIVDEKLDAAARYVFTLDELRTIAQACRRVDDDKRHILAMQLDTGARLAEIAGLRVEDVFLGEEVPYVHIRPHPKLGRTLKTEASERKVPLVGEALWAAQRAVESAKRGSKGSGWLFPVYASDDGIKNATASATLNGWLKNLTGTPGTTHSFRHAMKDRLRDAEVAKDIQDRIIGHSDGSIGEQYGRGYTPAKLRQYMLKIVMPPVKQRPS